MKFLALLVIAALLLTFSTAAAPGELDPAFNGNGLVKFKFGESHDTARASVLQTDGRIVVAGGISIGPNLDFGVARFNSDGTLDATFNFDGIAATDIDANENYATAVAIQPDGKIIAAGYARTSAAFSIDFAVARYESNGFPDITFGSGGVVTTPISPGSDYATSIIVQSDGKIVVGGYTSTVNGEDYALVRYNDAGNLDTTFDADGIVTTDISGDNDRLNALNLQSDGKLVASGHSNLGTDVFSLVRYNPNGSLDSSFDSDGVVTTPGTNLCSAAFIQPDGKIVAAGGSTLARYNPDGSLDLSFGIGGTIFFIFGGATNIFGAALQPDGDILVTGMNFNGARFEWGVARRLQDGQPDMTFGNAGVVTTSIGADQNTASSVLFDPSDNSVVVIGDAFSGLSDVALARYNADGTLQTMFGTGGIVTADLYPETAIPEALAVQPDGKIVVVGTETRLVLGNSVTIARLLPNGLPDPAFRGNGKFSALLDNRSSGATSVAIQTDGKIVIAFSGVINGVGVARFESNGNDDPTFSGDGHVFSTPPGIGFPRSVAVQPDGKILVAATLGGASTDFAVLRYTADGSLDTSFDGDGVSTAPVGINSDQAYALTLQPDGRIVVVGLAGTNSSSECCDFGVIRLTSNGSLDTTFDVDGRLTLGMGTFTGQARSVVVQSDGKIVVAGYSDDDFGLIRLNSNGTPDFSFGTNGRRVVNVGPFVDRAESVIVQSDGKILVAGWSSSLTDYDFAVVRLNSDGTFDNSFAPLGAGLWGVGGVALANFGSSDDYGAAMQFDPLGRVVVTGRAGTSFGVARFQNLTPTAANVSVSGRVLTSGGAGVRNATVELTDAAGNVRRFKTGTFGYYRFDEIEAGQTITLAASGKRFQIPPIVRTVSEDLTDVDFVVQDN